MGGEDKPVFLVGFMASGKSTVGRVLARILGWGYCDLDEMIERRVATSVAEIFRREGEAAFRRLEQRVLETLGERSAVVVACGGGIMLSHAQRGWLRRRGRTVWIDVPLHVARGRLARGAAGRPLWDEGDPLDLRCLFERRRAVYALATHRVDGVADPEAVARRIAGLVGPAPN